MIAVDRLLYKIDQRLNRLASDHHQKIFLEDKILILNEAQIILIKRKKDEVGEKSYHGLQFLIENYNDHVFDLKKGDKKLNQYYADISNLEPKMMFYVDGYMTADKGECKDRKIHINPDLLKQADIQVILNNSLTKPSFEYQETCMAMSSDKLYVYTDGTFTPKKLYLSYMRYPKEIDKSGYIRLDGTLSKDSDCELPEYLETELLDICEQLIGNYTENLSALASAKIKQNSNN